MIISLIILIEDKEAPPIFVQKRVGKNGRLFKIYKFRFMYLSLLLHNESKGIIIQTNCELCIMHRELRRFGNYKLLIINHFDSQFTIHNHLYISA